MTGHQDRPGTQAGRGASFWLTGLAFTVLGAIALAVFVLLPRWVAEPAATGVEIQSSPQPPIETGSGAANIPAAPPETTAPQTQRSASPQPARVAPAIDPERATFARAMAEGLNRLDRGELEASRAAFEAALALSPGAPDAAEGLARVDAAEQLGAITSHRQRALAFEEEERWDQTAGEYLAVLALDPEIQFAQQGLASASARSELADRLEGHIQRPDRLSEDLVLDQARALLASAERTDSPGPVLSRQIDTLRRKIDVASTPIRVVLRSDGLTSVLLYRVGQLGTFESKELQLRPGTYTIVGTRKGFRDVRHRLEVSPGSALSVTVRCEEKI